MSKKIEGVTVVHNGTECDLYLEQFANNGRPALALVKRATGEPWCRAVINVPVTDLKPYEVVIKDYSECEGLLAALVAAKVVEPTGVFVQLGHVQAPVCRLTLPGTPAGTKELVYPNIERLLGLHQELEVQFVVTGYHAQLLTNDGKRAVAMITGDTVQEALERLDHALSTFTPEQIKT